MAIVKMSQFELFVMNQDVDQLIETLQRFEAISFAQLEAVPKGMKPYASAYDFEANHNNRQQIQTILKKLGALKKKETKGSLLRIKDLGMQSMTFNELEQRVAASSLDTLLAAYSENYEAHTDKIGSFKVAAPHAPSRFNNDVLNEFCDQKPLVGVMEAHHVEGLLKELLRLDHVVTLYQPPLPDKPSMVAIFATEEYQDSVDILIEKYEVEKRSAVSLHIEAKISTLKDLLREIIDKQHSLNDRLSSIGFYQDVLMAHYESLNNEALREATKLKFFTTQHITLIQGWVMSDDEDAFKLRLHHVCGDAYDLNIFMTPIHSKDVPIKLKNNRFVSAFEIITNMYSQPRYDEPDPTPIFSVFYALFFGMMLADFGYGVLMFGVTFSLIHLLTLKQGVLKMMRMLMYVSIPTMIWGIIYGSFFGGIIPLTPLIDINRDFNTVLVMALVIGIIHIYVALGVKAYIYMRDYKIRYVLYDVVFWYLTLTGAIVLITQMFTDIFAPYQRIAMTLMVIGMVGIVLTNGRGAKSPGGKLAGGLYSLYGLSNYVGDVVSYSRLMALGLAGASIGVAFNMMIAMVGGMGIFSIILGSIIFVVGHTFNLFISGLSAYVHSARLTYVEFFGKFFVGGGKAYHGFIAKPTYIKIEKE